MTMDNASRSAFGAEATELVPGAAPSLFGICLWFVSGRGSISIDGLALSHLLHLKPLGSKKQHPADVRRSYSLEVVRMGVLIFPAAPLPEAQHPPDCRGRAEDPQANLQGAALRRCRIYKREGAKFMQRLVAK